MNAMNYYHRIIKNINAILKKMVLAIVIIAIISLFTDFSSHAIGASKAAKDKATAIAGVIECCGLHEPPLN